MNVEKITYEQAKPWILNKHYAKRMPHVQFAYGLFNDSNLIGIIAYGMPANRCNAKMGDYPMWELVRLSLENNIKNGASFLIGRSLNLLPKPCFVISYADTHVGHVGYVYQATNWIYTGMSRRSKEFIIDGKKYHEKNAFNQFGTSSVKKLSENHNVKINLGGRKYRYIYTCGSKCQKKEMMKQLKWQSMPYPKGESKHTI